MNRRTRTTLALAAIASALPQTAAADEPPKLEAPKTEYVVDPAGKDGRRDGVDWQLNTGATFSLNNNASVVGQPDGSTLLVGFKIDALVDYNHAAHEWRNTLAVNGGMARTPLVDELVKSRDALNFESIYLYHAVPSLGPFARLVLETSMFRGTDVRSGPTTYLIQRRDGGTEARAGDRLALTDPLQPLALKQSVGAFARPVAKDEVSFEVRAGVGARETIAKDGLAVSDDAATPDVEVKELDDIVQVGVEVTAQLWGAISQKRVLYRVAAEVMTPFAQSALAAGDERGAIDLTNLSLTGMLSFKLVDWASLDYELRAVRNPQLLDKLQLQNNLLFTVGLSAGNLPKAKQ